jgi:hypothetical protein
MTLWQALEHSDVSSDAYNTNFKTEIGNSVIDNNPAGAPLPKLSARSLLQLFHPLTLLRKSHHPHLLPSYPHWLIHTHTHTHTFTHTYTAIATFISKDNGITPHPLPPTHTNALLPCYSH